MGKLLMLLTLRIDFEYYIFEKISTHMINLQKTSVCLLKQDEMIWALYRYIGVKLNSKLCIHHTNIHSMTLCEIVEIEY